MDGPSEDGEEAVPPAYANHPNLYHKPLDQYPRTPDGKIVFEGKVMDPGDLQDLFAEMDRLKSQYDAEEVGKAAREQQRIDAALQGMTARGQADATAAEKGKEDRLASARQRAAGLGADGNALVAQYMKGMHLKNGKIDAAQLQLLEGALTDLANAQNNP
jgi:hypothetical protein